MVGGGSQTESLSEAPSGDGSSGPGADSATAMVSPVADFLILFSVTLIVALSLVVLF